MIAENQEQRIRERAYLIWIEDGEPNGRDKAHWEIAKAQLDEEDRKRAGTFVRALRQL